MVITIFTILVFTVGILMARARVTTFVPQQTTPIIQPIESMTVKPGTLTVTLSSTGALTPADNQVLSFGASAPVTDVKVAVGDQVHAGDIMAQLDTTNIDAQIRNAQIGLTQAQNSLNALTAPPREIDLKIAEEGVTAAQASLSGASQTGSTATDIQIAQLQEEISKNSLWQAQLNRDMSAASARPNAPNADANNIQTAASLAQSQSNVDISQLNYQSTANDGPNASQLSSASAQLLSAQANLNSLTAGPDANQLRQAQIAVETAQLSLDQAQTLRDNAVLKAPFDGVVAAVNIVQGAIPPSTGAITLINISGYTITLSVDEKDITKLAVGQLVSLSVQALRNATVTGTVTRINPAPTLSGQLVNYAVQVTLSGSEQRLRPGMTAVADVTLNQLDNILVLPNRFLTTNATTNVSTVKVMTGTNNYQDVVVTLGTQTTSESQILSGLTAGQTVVILPAAGEAGAGAAGFGLFGRGAGAPGGGGAFPGAGAAGGGGFTGGGGGGGGNFGGRGGG
ncbi:MAG: efflux RND transporter periplasmic adaptor subunit, partial [Chloroflexota bacterium]